VAPEEMAASENDQRFADEIEATLRAEGGPAEGSAASSTKAPPAASEPPSEPSAEPAADAPGTAEGAPPAESDEGPRSR
jgi:hypothetical protein